MILSKRKRAKIRRYWEFQEAHEHKIAEIILDLLETCEYWEKKAKEEK